MEQFLSKNGTIAELKEGLQLMENNPLVKTIMILACDNNNFSVDTCNPILQQTKKPIIGGIFPAIIHETTVLNNGTLIIGFKYSTQIHTIENVSNTNTDFEELLAHMFTNTAELKTMTVLVDAFSKRISALIESLFVVLGLEYSYIGGGAGSLSMEQKPCILTNKGIQEDCAVIAGLDAECGIGVKHGWTSISGPYKVTSAVENKITTIDYKPAFEVYKEIIKTQSNSIISDHNFFDIAKAYPLGINKLGAEKVVRAPLSAKNNDLICVGEVLEGAFFDVLNGNKQSLIEAAEQAANASREDLNGAETNFTLVFDCISRALFLEDVFTEELKSVKQKNTPMIGVLSIGEIANNKKDYLELYNKTAVVASFKK